MGVIKTVAVFGGTGMTGTIVVDKAVKSGLNVRLLVRDSSTVPSSLEGKVTLIRGDVTNRAAVKEAIGGGVDGVIVTLGTRNKLDATTVMSTGVQNIVDVMKELDVKPLSVCLSSFLLMPESAVPAMFHEINKEHGRMLEVLKSSSDVSWVACLPPHIADSPEAGYLVKEGALPGGRVVSKYDLAQFLIDTLSQPDNFKKIMAISSKS